MKTLKTMKWLFVIMAIFLCLSTISLNYFYNSSPTFQRFLYTETQSIANPEFHQIYENVYMENYLDEEREKEIISYVEETIPKALLYENDYVIIFTDRELIADVLYTQGYTIVGATNHAEKVITIKYEYAEHSLLHEIGHAVDYDYGYSGSSEFIELYNRVAHDTYVTSNEREYFAHNYGLFIEGNLHDPELYKYFCLITCGYCFVIGG